MAICVSATACSIGLLGNATAQLSNTTSHSIYDPYPARQNPFRDSRDTDAQMQDAAVHSAQFNELIPNAADEAEFGSTIVSGATMSDGANGPMTSTPSDSGNGIITGPEFPGDPMDMMGQTIEYTSEFDPSMTGTDSALLHSSSSWFRRGFWYSQQEFVMMLRSQVEEVFIASDQSFGTLLNRPTLTMADANFTFEPGARLTLGRFLGQDITNRDVSVEFTFFGLLEHTGDAEFESVVPRAVDTALGDVDYNTTAFGGGISGPGVPGFTATDRQTLFYRSAFNSYELNVKMMGRPNRDRIALQPSGAWIRHASSTRIRSGLLGFRGLSIGESFRYKSFRDDALLGDYRLRVNNDMFGVQIGGELAEYYGDWSWGGRFKAGGLVNFAQRRDSAEVIGDASPARFNAASDDHLAVLLEAGINTTYHFSPNFTGRLGYDFMYVTGIADAPNNASLSPAFSRFEITNDAYYHGLTLGFEMLW